MDTRGRVALVTGGASGIGLACVQELLMGGVNVSICDKNTEAGEAAVKVIEKKFGPGRALFIETDVQKQSSLEGAFKKTKDTFRRLDIVINNAGIIEPKKWEETITVNLTAVARGTKLALDHMSRDAGGTGGVVVNVSSIFGLQNMPACPVYAATKHGVIGLSRSYGVPHYYNRTGVRVLTVCPGVTNTSMLDQYQDSEEKSADFWKGVEDVPYQEPETVGKAILHLVRQAPNGSVWVIEGGEPVYEVHFSHREEMTVFT